MKKIKSFATHPVTLLAAHHSRYAISETAMRDYYNDNTKSEVGY